jgi:hypothetical protein
MLQEKAYFEFQIHLIGSPKDLEVWHGWHGMALIEKKKRIETLDQPNDKLIRYLNHNLNGLGRLI